MANRKLKQKRLRNWDEVKVELLREDPEFAIEYLKMAFQENADIPEALVEAIRSVSRSLDLSLEQVAKKAGISKASIYKALGENGNPTLATLTSILDAMGLRLSIEEKTG